MRAVLQPLARAVRSFRLGMEAQGNEACVALVDALLAALAEPGRAPLADQLAPLLPEILAAQARGDCLRVADLLEHELRPRLTGQAAARPSAGG